MVVDGVREVTISGNGGPEIRVPVRENFFYADLGDRPVDRVRWDYAGREHEYDVGGSFPDDGPDPNTGFDPVPGTFSDPVRFTVGDVSYSAVGYQAANDTVCINLDEGRERPSRSCEGVPGLRRRLGEQPAHLFAGGGALNGFTKHTGFARADVIGVDTLERADETTVILSEPWQGIPSDGARIRFLIILAPAHGDMAPGTVRWPKLRVRLADGRSYLIES
jgi:hypothetical protein